MYDRKRQILYYLTCMWNVEKKKEQKQILDWGLPGLGVGV